MRFFIKKKKKKKVIGGIGSTSFLLWDCECLLLLGKIANDWRNNLVKVTFLSTKII